MGKHFCSVLIWLAVVAAAGAVEPEPEWRSTGGPAGSTAYDVVDTDEGAVLIGTEDGVWRLEPGEFTWRRSGIDGLRVVAIGRADDGELFSASRRESWPYVHRSTDGGRTWEVCEQGLSTAERWIWGLDAGPDGAMLAAGERGVFRFDVLAGAWKRYSADVFSTSTATDGETVYVGSFRYVYRSSDNGATWQQAFVADDIGINELALGDDGLVVATAVLKDFWQADDGVVFVSTDYGASFTLADGVTGSGTEIGLKFGYGAEVLDDGTILVGGYRELPYGPYGGVRASTDLGQTWFSTGIDFFDVWKVKRLDDGRLWAVGSEAVMLHDGERWTRFIDGLYATDVYALASTPAGLLAGGFCMGVSVLEEDGALWRWMGPELVTASSVAGTPDGAAIATFTVYGARRWTSEGGWESIGIESNSPQRVAVDSVGTICVMADGCHCSSDGGDSWNVTDFDMGHAWAMTAMAEGGFAVALFRPTTGAGMVVRTVDGGLNWQTSMVTPSAVKDLVWDRGGRLWSIRITGEVAVSDDLGLSWRPLTKAGPGTVWTSITVDHLGRVYAGSEDGFVRTSNDGGFTWRSFDDGGFSAAVKDLAVHRGVLYAAVGNRGVWSTPVSPLVRGGSLVGRRVAP